MSRKIARSDWDAGISRQNCTTAMLDMLKYFDIDTNKDTMKMKMKI